MEKTISKITGSFSLRAAPYICLALLFIPILTGSIGIILPALGYFPALGVESFSLNYFKLLLAAPSIIKSIFFSLYIGIVATFISFCLAFLTVVIFYEKTWFETIRKCCIPLIALPHAALAIALSFLIIPSGFLARLFSPWLTGWQRPPDLLIAQDSWGISMIITLIAKETPFLVLMMIAALSQIKVVETLNSVRSMGYQRLTIWIKCILPQFYKSIRLPIYAILVFSISVVDIALIIGPQTPFPLAVRILEWFNHPANLNFKLPAAAGSLLLLFICIFAILLWELGTKLLKFFLRNWFSNGNRGRNYKYIFLGFKFFLTLAYILILLGFLALVLWSFTLVWRFPNWLPTSWTISNWSIDFDTLWELFYSSLIIGSLASLISIVLVILCLEREILFLKNLTDKGLFLIYIPLLVPQISIMFGFQVFIAKLNLEGRFWSVLWAHLIFVLPYVFLALGDTYRSFETRYQTVALGLGVSKWKFFWRVKIMLLLEPILLVFAIGFSVSIALYIPTLFIGAGRINTITTEAVNLFSGANRKFIGVYTSLQMLLPFLFLWGAFFVKSLPIYWKKVYYYFYLKNA